MFQKLKKIRFDLAFFYLFIFTISINRRHIFNLDTAKINNIFNEWQAISIYISDIFLIICFIFWLIYSLKKRPKQKTNKWLLIFPGLILLFSLVSLAMNYNNYLDPNIGWFKIIKLVEFILLFVFIIKNINTKKTIIVTTFVFVVSGIIQSMIAIGQYFLQQSLMLKSLGEPLIFTTLPNVAKIVLDNGKILIRAYGTFPHPNVLAGFLIASIMLTVMLMLYRCRYYDLIKPRTRILTILLSFGLILQMFAIVFSFSRTAWIGLIIALVAFLILNFKTIKKASSIIWSKKFIHPYIIIILAIIFVIISQWPQITSRAAIEDQHGDGAVSNRVFYNDASFDMIEAHPIFGIGYNNFTNQLKNFTDQNIEWWQYQPAHNIYLLIFAELGIFGLLSFLGLIFFIGYQIFTKQQTIFQKTAFSILIALLFIALFDHYLLTIQQGQLLFWLILGLAAVNLRQKK